MTYFTCTSKEDYDRHNYRLIFKNGKSIEFDDWEVTRNYWFQWSGTNQLSHVDVLDKSKVKSKGFK